MELTPIFNQYLRYTEIPKLEFRKDKKGVAYRWLTNEKNFAMPVDVMIKGKKIRLNGTNEWKTVNVKVKSTQDIHPVTEQFYIRY